MDWLNNKNETSAFKSPATFAESKLCGVFMCTCLCVRGDLFVISNTQRIANIREREAFYAAREQALAACDLSSVLMRDRLYQGKQPVFQPLCRGLSA